MSHPAVADALNRSIDATLGRYVVPGGPGFAILVMDENGPLLLKGYGCARMADAANGIEQEEITTETVFDLASMSKQFTAIAVLMLVDQTTQYGPDGGKYKPLSLDTQLSEFFPRLPGARHITIRMLLSHSSGLPDYFAIQPYRRNYERELDQIGVWYATMAGYAQMEGKTYLKNKDVLTLIQRRDLDFAPGSGYNYSNTGFVVLAEIIRTITGKSLKKFLEMEIFDRLKMHNTFVYDETVQGFDKHALCYRKGPDGQYVSIESDTELNYIHGDGNVHSTIEDMVKWQKACDRIDDLEELTFTGGGPLIKRSTFLDVFEPLIRQRKRLDYRPGARGYSAGFNIYRYLNRNVSDFVLYHGGDWLGFHSYVVRAQVQFNLERVAPEDWKRFSVVVLSNNELLSPNERVNSMTLLKELVELYWRSWGLPERYDVMRYIWTESE